MGIEGGVTISPSWSMASKWVLISNLVIYHTCSNIIHDISLILHVPEIVIQQHILNLDYVFGFERSFENLKAEKPCLVDS